MKRVASYIHVVWRIFARDLKRLVTNPIALIVTLGICLMPSLYAWYVIVANWEPYHETQNLKVGVANNDTGCDLEKLLQQSGVTIDEADLPKTLNVGDEVVDRLHDNHQLGWEFVTEDEALDRVRSGEYYAAIIIPSGFSRDFASVFSGRFIQPTIDYYVNEKLSSVAPHVTIQGAKTLEQAIDEEFVSTVSEAVVELTQAAATYAESKADEADGSLTRGVADTAKAMTKTRDLLDGLDDTIAKTTTAADEGIKAVDDAAALVPSLTEKLTKTETALTTARDDVNRYGIQSAHDLGLAADQAQQLTAQAEEAMAALSAQATIFQQAAGKALTQAEGIAVRNEALLDALQTLVANGKADASNATVTAIAKTAAAALDALQAQNTALTQTLDGLNQSNDEAKSQVATVEKALTSLNDGLSSDEEAIAKASDDFETTVIPALTKGLDDAALAVGDLRGSVSGLSTTLTQAKAILSELSTLLNEAEDGVTAARSTIGSVENTLESASQDLQALQGSSLVKRLTRYLGVDAENVGGFMASPVTLHRHVFYPVKNYGSGVAPFFTNLALWAAGFILLAMIKLRVDPEGLPSFTPIQGYWGRWLLFMVLSVAQALVACVGDLVIGVQCANPVAYVAVGVVTVLVDMNIMFALAYALRHIGKAINVILLIIQIPGSSGLFPVEMMPPVYQALNPYLPFTYSCNAFREAIGGFYGANYALDLLALAAYIPLSLAFGIIVGNYAFNLSLMFDKKLVETDLLVTDDNGGAQAHWRLRTLLRAMLNTDRFRDTVTQRAARFHRRYPWLIRIGWVALLAQPVIMFCLLSVLPVDINGKVLLLLILAGTVVLVDTYLIIVEFVDSELAQEVGMASLTQAELQQQGRQRASLFRFFAHLRDETNQVTGTMKAAKTAWRKGKNANGRDVDEDSENHQDAETTGVTPESGEPESGEPETTSATPQDGDDNA